MKKSTPTLSIIWILVVSQLLVSAAIFLAYGFYRYKSDTEEIKASILAQADESLQRLAMTLPGYMEAYQIKEYEDLIFTETNTDNHESIVAILVENNAMAEITGRSSYVSGYVRTEKGDIQPFSPNDNNQKITLDKALYLSLEQLYDSQDSVIGQIKIYISDHRLIAASNKLLIDLLGVTFLLIVIQSSLSTLIVRGVILSPLSKLSKAVSDRDEDGLPRRKLPFFKHLEFQLITNAIEKMLTVIRQTRDKLKAEHQKLENVIDGTNAGTWFWNIQTGETEFNERWAEIIGYKLSELAPISINTWLEHTHPDDLAITEQILKDHFTGKSDHYECECRMRHKNGHWVWVLDRGKISKRDADGNPLEMFGTHIDITSAKANESQLKLAANVFKYVNEGILITDKNGTIVDVNDAFLLNTGYRKDELIGKNPRLFKSDLHDDAFYKELWKKLHSEGQWRGEIFNKRKNGDVCPELIRISKVQQPLGDDYQLVALYSDISAIKEHEQQLEMIAHYDILTDLPNRTLFQKRLIDEIALGKESHKQFALLFIDLDGFKQINDTHGHDVGDNVLITAAERMTALSRDGDTIARLGGDEFIAILSGVRKTENIGPIVDRFLLTLSKPMEFNNLSVSVSASIGVTLFDHTKEIDPSRLIKQADIAMYNAKMLGKNRYAIYSPELGAE